MKERVILAVELNKDQKLQIRINTKNEGILSLALLAIDEKVRELYRSVVVNDKKVESSVIVQAYFNKHDEIDAEIFTTSKALAAMSLRKAYQATEVYLEEQEIKKEMAVKKVLTTIPQDVLRKIRG